MTKPMSNPRHTRRRSALSLVVSGASTVSLDQRMSRISKSIGGSALRDDVSAVRRDARRSYKRLHDQLEHA